VAVLLLTAPIVVAAAAAEGQSLGAAAERERQKRRGQKTAAKVYGNEDLDKGGAGDAADGEPASKPTADKPSPSPQPSPAETTPALDKNLEREWRMRFAAARERIARAEAAAYTTRVETVFVAGIPVQQQVRVFEETEDLRAARRALDDLEDELRRAGLPPGWGRE
jgi:hypothetical protein